MEVKNPQSKQESPKSRKRGNPLFSIFALALLLFVALPLLYQVAQNNAEIKKGREYLEQLKEEERLLDIENEQLGEYAKGENLDEYIDKFARDEMGYADPQERVYYVVPN